MQKMRIYIDIITKFINDMHGVHVKWSAVTRRKRREFVFASDLFKCIHKTSSYIQPGYSVLTLVEEENASSILTTQATPSMATRVLLAKIKVT